MTHHAWNYRKNELGNGYHWAESTAHCLLQVSSCKPGNRKLFTASLFFTASEREKMAKRTWSTRGWKEAKWESPWSLLFLTLDSIFGLNDQITIRQNRGLRTVYGFRASSVTRTNFAVSSYGKFRPGRLGWNTRNKTKIVEHKLVSFAAIVAWWTLKTFRY